MAVLDPSSCPSQRTRQSGAPHIGTAAQHNHPVTRALLLTLLLAPTAHAAPASPHTCAVFGATIPVCDSYPNWTKGDWQPPPGAAILRVLLVAGGGGGAASIERGIGGTGGGSGSVLVGTLAADAHPIPITIGQKGFGGGRYRSIGTNGGASTLGPLTAPGGQGALTLSAGGAPPNTTAGASGASGGGGAGGGTYQKGHHGGDGGDGGTAGSPGTNGSPGTDPKSPVSGTNGGTGRAFPPFIFQNVTFTAGGGGLGGLYGQGRIGYGGGGGGGGGGVQIPGTKMEAANGASACNCAITTSVMGGEGGGGFGAGGGGGGNFVIGANGGPGAPGFVYVEWSQTISLR